MTATHSAQQWSQSDNNGATVTKKKFCQLLEERIKKAKGVRALVRELYEETGIKVEASDITRARNPDPWKIPNRNLLRAMKVDVHPPTFTEQK